VSDSDVAEQSNLRVDEGDHERFAHIIKKRDQMRGYVEGKAVVALCGKKWVPTRDPQKFPVCPTCKEVLAGLHGA
jgi:hypothetical protein